MRLAHLALLAVLVTPLASQTPGAGTTAIRAARMLDVRAGRIVTNAVVVVAFGKITQVGDAVPAGAEVIDLGDVTLMPGLLDAHVHLTGELGPGFETASVRETAADEALKGAYYGRKTLMAGFTTVRNVGSSGFSDVALQRAIERGEIDGPRVIPAGHALGITGGHCDITGFAPGILVGTPHEGVANGADEMIMAVREQAKYGAKVIKICATAGVLSFDATVGAQQMSDAELVAVVEEASRHGLKVAAHAHGTAGIKAAIRAGVASIEHGSMLDDEAIAMMKARGTWLVPTRALQGLINRDILPPPIRAKMNEVLPLADASFRKAVAAGVKIALGTDAAVMPHGMNAKEFSAMVAAGMTPIAAIRAATINAAELLDTPDRGEIVVGKLADLIAVPGNPMADVTVMERVSFVMIGGRRVK